MARPIKETPILFGKDAHRFEERMQEKRPESEADKKERMEVYHAFMSILQV